MGFRDTFENLRSKWKKATAFDYEDGADENTARDEAEDVAPPFGQKEPRPSKSGRRKGNIVSMHDTPPGEMIVHPTAYDTTACDYADDLISGRSLVVNMEHMRQKPKCDLVNFLVGVVYARGGSWAFVDKSKNTLFLVPPNVPLQNDLSQDGERGDDSVFNDPYDLSSHSGY